MQRNRAAFAANKGMLQGIRKQFVDDKARWHGDVDRHRIGIHLEVEPDTLDGIGAQYRRGDLAEIYAEIDLTFGATLSEQAVKKLDGFNAAGESVEWSRVYATLGVAGLHAHEGRDHLEIVLDAVLHLFQQHVLVLNEFLELLALLVRPDFDQRDEAITGCFVLTLDDV